VLESSALCVLKLVTICCASVGCATNAVLCPKVCPCWLARTQKGSSLIDMLSIVAGLLVSVYGCVYCLVFYMFSGGNFVSAASFERAKVFDACSTLALARYSRDGQVARSVA
jgi:hypothetical protein